MSVGQTPILSVIGKKNSGKSTLAEFLIRELKNCGLHIGANKHSSHHHHLDKAGRDSDRFHQAGASPIVFSTPDGLSVFYYALKPEDELQLLDNIFKNCDLVIIESLRSVNCPKLWICTDQHWDEMPGQVIAIISNNRRHPTIPTFEMHDQKLIRFIINHFDLKI